MGGLYGQSRSGRNSMCRIIGLVLLGIGVGAVAMAQSYPAHWSAPEIDPASGASALALVTGTFVLIRSRRKRNKRASKALETPMV